MSAPRSGSEIHRVEEDPDVVIDVDASNVEVSVDRTHGLLAVVRDARRATPPPLVDDDPRHEIFEGELPLFLRLTGRESDYTTADLLAKRDQLLDRIATPNEVESLFDEMIDSILTARTVEACAEARFEIRFLTAVVSIYRPDIFASGVLEIGRHFYGRAEQRLVREESISDFELRQQL